MPDGKSIIYNKKDGYAVLACVMLVAVIGIISVALAIFFSNTQNIPKHETVYTVYDSTVLRETDEMCPECGTIGVAVNGELVCRNEDCPNYGIAVYVGQE